MISLEFTEEPDTNWNRRLLDSPMGSIFQTKEYGFAKRLTGSNPHFIKFLSNSGDVVGQLLLFSLPRFTSQNIVKKILKKTSLSKNTILRWTYGPIIFNHEHTNTIVNKLKEFLISKHSKVYGKEFPLSDNILSSIGDPFTITKKATFLLDLSKGKDKLWDLMDKNSVRKNIKRSEERGIQIREMKKSDLATYLELLEETGKTQRFNEESESSEWWDILKQVGYRGLLAYENDVPIAAMAAAYFAGYVNEFGIVRTQRDRDAKLYSQDLLKWKIIEWSIEQKFRYYDFSGVSPESNDPKEQGIYRYKKKWGGALTQFNLLTL